MRRSGSWTKRLRRLRRNRRGVSEIIAEVLLIAITVILVGTLYAFIASLIPGRLSAPVGGALLFGTASNDSGTYHLPVAYAGSGLQLGYLGFTIRVPGGAVWSGAWHLHVQSLLGDTVATYLPGTGWEALTDRTFSLSSEESLLIDATATGGLPAGAVFVTAASGPYAGTIDSPLA